MEPNDNVSRETQACEENPKADEAILSTWPEPDEQTEFNPYLRAENEDDDGYDPYSDRPPAPEPLFQENPWD